VSRSLWNEGRENGLTNEEFVDYLIKKFKMDHGINEVQWGSVSDEEKEDLEDFLKDLFKDMFNNFDTNKDGLLKHSEIEAEMLGEEAKIKSVFEKADNDKNGHLCKTEVIDFAKVEYELNSGNMDPPHQEVVKNLFAAADLDGNGEISIEEVTKHELGFIQELFDLTA